MQKTILVTGATDGIGFETAKLLVPLGHTVLIHGRNPDKLADTEKRLADLGGGRVESYRADLSRMGEVEALAKAVCEDHDRLDVLINNAGIFRTQSPVTADGLDVRFAVNTLAPYLLTERLLPLMGSTGRVVNLSSAAQAPVDVDALTGKVRLSDEMAAYAQSKLAITMWSREMARALGKNGPAIIAVNPGSLLASKMVREGFGVAGNDLSIGAEILVQAALSDDFADASGTYFDNDSGRFAAPHPDALDAHRSQEVLRAIEAVLAGV
jgi:NAD(P)-dependent dehydrogenase (short-subunit alcohol dehydrogenase family)